MERVVRFCTAKDGVRIAYSVEGQGPPLVMTPLVFESYLMEGPEYREFSSRLAASCQLIQYDPRNVGSSQRGVEAVDGNSLSLDIEAVVAATGLERVSLFGRAMMSLAAVRFAGKNPEVVDRLLLHAPLNRMEDRMSIDEAKGLIQMCRGNWDMAARIIADMSSRPEFGDRAMANADWYRRSATGDDIARIMEANMQTDVSQVYGQLTCPVLVIQPMSDARWTLEGGQQIASAIEDASFAPLPGGLHQFALGDREPIVGAILDFLGAQGAASSAPQQAFRTILFTDIEGSTALTDRLGDVRARDLLREHERVVREALKAHGGSEVKTLGDGFMASFSSATKALECAIAMQRAFAERNESAGEPIKVRIGLNAGEPIAEDDPGGRGDLFGASVNRAARIAAMAQGGEILVANVVRELAEGKGFLFGDRGETALRGFDDPVRLFEVRWRD